jgi:hypothetical protein
MFAQMRSASRVVQAMVSGSVGGMGDRSLKYLHGAKVAREVKLMLKPTPRTEVAVLVALAQMEAMVPQFIWKTQLAEPPAASFRLPNLPSAEKREVLPEAERSGLLAVQLRF